MNVHDSEKRGLSSDSSDRWVHRSTDLQPADSAITKMQHQYWVTKQALSRKLGKKEDECIISSDAELDAKLELFRSIQDSCAYLQRVIDKYQERLCNLAQEENAMGRFLKEAGKQEKTRAGKMMSAVGKSLSYSGQQRLSLHAPLVRLYQEVETFRQRAIEDTLKNVQSMEKARTEYRAALSWMKNISQELDPDTSKQLERFRKVQTRVKRGKSRFDNEAFDCLQKVDLLAAARCNMFSHALVLYQSTLLNFTKKSAQAYATIANSFVGYQQYDFVIVKELAGGSISSGRLVEDEEEESGEQDREDRDKLLFFESEYSDNLEQAKEASVAIEETKKSRCDERFDENLVDIEESDSKSCLISKGESLCNVEKKNAATRDAGKDLDDLFNRMLIKESEGKEGKGNDLELEKSLNELDLAMDSFTENGGAATAGNDDVFDFNKATSLGIPPEVSQQNQQPLEVLTSENVALLEDILNSGPSINPDWDPMSSDTFLPKNILNQSLGDAMLNIEKERSGSRGIGGKKDHTGKSKENSKWLDLFADLDPLSNNSIENLTKSNSSSNAPA